MCAHTRKKNNIFTPGYTHDIYVVSSPQSTYINVTQLGFGNEVWRPSFLYYYIRLYFSRPFYTSSDLTSRSYSSCSSTHLHFYAKRNNMYMREDTKKL